MVKRLLNKSIQIAGSCSRDGNHEIIEYCHELIRTIVKNLLSEGATFVTTVDKYVTMDGINGEKPAIIFYWDVLDEIYEYAKKIKFSEEVEGIAKVITTKKSLNQIPSKKQKMWDELCSQNVVNIYQTPYGWNSGAVRRQMQESFSDAIILVGGGEGVEHLAQLHAVHGKPVLPLDIPVGSSCNDGRGGASYLSESFIFHPEKFIPNINDKLRTQSSLFTYQKWKNKPKEYAHQISEFVSKIVIPQVFFVRLLNEKNKNYNLVSEFFKDVVTPFVIEKGYKIKDMEISKNKEGFLNVEIFQELNKSSIVIADLTSLRNDCFLELGYGFGLNRKIIVTAKKDTKLSFDSTTIPCYFWDLSKSKKDIMTDLNDFWEQNIYRGPLVSIPGLI